jgi:hypothetical protein
MPSAKSIYVSGPLYVVRCMECLNFQQVRDNMPCPIEVDKDLGKFYYLINRASTQHFRQDPYS